MHLVRLLLSGIALLRDGVVVVRVEDHRDRLLAIREGSVSWQEVDACRLELYADLDAAYASTRLPERPDYEAANRFLLRHAGPPRSREAHHEVGGRDDRLAPSRHHARTAIFAPARDG